MIIKGKNLIESTLRAEVSDVPLPVNAVNHPAKEKNTEDVQE